MARSLPTTIYRVDAVREMDRQAIEVLGIPGFTLMGRAGEAAMRELRLRWPRARRLLVLCGARNNAGDGYVLARLARAEGLLVTVVALIEPERLTGDAAVAWESYKSSGGTVETWRPGLLGNADVVIDAVLGTGLARPLVGGLREIVEAVNASGRDVFSIDIPTGLHADTGLVLGAAMRATMTMTFIALKLGLFVGDAPDYTGELRFDDLGVGEDAGQSLPVAARRIDRAALATRLPRRRRTAHKGDFGHVLIVGGDTGYAGAVLLAGEAALRTGAGRVTVATRSEHVAAIVGSRPELMCRGVGSPAELDEMMASADVVAVGPGLGQGPWGRALYESVIATDRPVVVDADALNLLAAAPQRRDHNWILTPHPGEAARLLGRAASQVQADRLGALAALVDRYGGTVVLKGAGTLVGQSQAIPSVCPLGNPGMATAGAGDVLTGIVAAMIAQLGELALAAELGVLAHAAAGDAAAQSGERGLLAGDLLAALRAIVNP